MDYLELKKETDIAQRKLPKMPRSVLKRQAELRKMLPKHSTHDVDAHGKVLPLQAPRVL